jgi:energy-coupling factor transport system ATP-binding protein
MAREDGLLPRLGVRELGLEARDVLVEPRETFLDRVAVLAEGETVSAGPVREVIAESPAFAPQVTKVLGPGWLRVAEVATALQSASDDPAPEQARR